MPQARKRTTPGDRADRRRVDGFVGSRPLATAAGELGSSIAFLQQFIAGKRELSPETMKRWAAVIGEDDFEREALEQLFSRCRLAAA